MTKIQNLWNKIIKGYAVLEMVDSKINGKIEIREDLLGRRTLVAGGLAQSGIEVERLWKSTLNNELRAKNKIQNCLILGLGAGTTARLLTKKLLGIKITGIEIDPEIIQLGKKYFGLDRIENLEIKVADIFSEVNNITIKQYNNGYNLILFDLYLGNQYPKQAESETFLQSVKKLLSPDGLIIINRLYYQDYDKQKTDEFGKILKKVFNQVKERNISWNKFYFCQ